MTLRLEHAKYTYSHEEKERKNRLDEFLVNLDRRICLSVLCNDKIDIWVYDIKDHKGILFANISLNMISVEHSWTKDDNDFLKKRFDDCVRDSWEDFNEDCYQVSFSLVGIKGKNECDIGSLNFTVCSQDSPIMSNYCYVDDFYNAFHVYNGILDNYVDDTYTEDAAPSRVITHTARYSVCSRQKWKCNQCATKLKYNTTSTWEGEVAHIDHIHPFSQMATYPRGVKNINEVSNLQALCPKCNLSKGKKQIH